MHWLALGRSLRGAGAQLNQAGQPQARSEKSQVARAEEDTVF